MIDTPFTRAFGLLHPYALAPFSPVSDGHLAAAVSRAGGLGLVFAGQLSQAAILAQHDQTGDEAVGWAIHTTRLDNEPEVLEQLLEFRPRALLLIGQNVSAHAKRITAKEVKLICVAQSVQDARHAIAANADVIVVQGRAAAGHVPSDRSTFALLPEVANEIYASHAETILLACGGISDARGIAASMIMGADGVMMGTRLWASQNSALTAEQRGSLLGLSGDAVEVQTPASKDDLHWRGIGSGADALAVGEGAGLINDMPEMEPLLNELTLKSSRLMTHIRRKVIE